ncbi:P-loop containing nucleoside triphosphate hydrolase protein [Baffinella frigidus]|nr:P-loop containing nucleoside triphosphate hydrolase protein [Cryptophyta sp. CCMP2293]
MPPSRPPLSSASPRLKTPTPTPVGAAPSRPVSATPRSSTPSSAPSPRRPSSATPGPTPAPKSARGGGGKQAASPRGVSPRPSWNGAVDDAPGAAVVGGVGEGGETAEEWLELELSKVIGLKQVKEQLRAFLRNLRLEARRREVGLPASGPASYDMVFYGNPGTGKTSVARLVPMILQRIGALAPNAPFLEVGRSDLVGAFIGATEANTQKKIEEARGGVIFIDEAYTLTPGDGARDFGIKALEVIMQCMTSAEKDRPRFIFAGYQAQMESFLQANAGMARRIAYTPHPKP